MNYPVSTCQEVGHHFRIRKVVNYTLSDDELMNVTIIAVILMFTVILIPAIPIYLWLTMRKVTSYELCERCGYKL